ncbi:MAG: hypothetical protein AB7H48_00805 [Parachlamydiales bacterium]
MNKSEFSGNNDIPITFKGFHKSYEYPSSGALRKMAFESEINGLGDAFLKIGRRRLVLPETLFRLLREKGSK